MRKKEQRDCAHLTLRLAPPSTPVEKIWERVRGGRAKNAPLIFTTSVSLGKGRGQQAAIKLMVQEEAMPNGPIRAEQVNGSSSVIG